MAVLLCFSEHYMYSDGPNELHQNVCTDGSMAMQHMTVFRTAPQVAKS